MELKQLGRRRLVGLICMVFTASLAVRCSALQLGGSTDDLEDGVQERGYAGWSSTGQIYQSADEVWEQLLERGEKDWYGRAVDHWAEAEPSVGGVLAGYTHLHEPDINDSREFLVHTYTQLTGDAEWLGKHGGSMTALDVGAGVGRITRHLLLPVFGQVELVEPAEPLLNKAREELGSLNIHGHHVTSFYLAGLQDFAWEKRYDVIWIQWCLLHLPDATLLPVLKRAAASLTSPHSVLFVKENTAPHGFVYVPDEHGVIRSPPLFRRLFLEAGLEVLAEGVQDNFDPGLFTVHMWALRPVRGSKLSAGRDHEDGVHVEL